MPSILVVPSFTKSATLDTLHLLLSFHQTCLDPIPVLCIVFDTIAVEELGQGGFDLLIDVLELGFVSLDRAVHLWGEGEASAMVAALWKEVVIA